MPWSLFCAEQDAEYLTRVILWAPCNGFVGQVRHRVMPQTRNVRIRTSQLAQGSMGNEGRIKTRLPGSRPEIHALALRCDPLF